MSLLVLMYHRAQVGRHGNPAEMLDAHFAHIARHCSCVLPGEPLDEDQLNVCLSFDDAYYDFHAIVHPLLEKHKLKALLAVAPGVIPVEVRAPAGERLALSAHEAFADSQRRGFCTWMELRALVRSGRVAIAAHGRTHVRLDGTRVDLTREIVEPRAWLEEQLNTPVNSFVYPFGRFSAEAHALTRRHYDFAFRIGQASNAGWSAPMLYRVDADEMRSPTALLSGGARFGYRTKAAWNRLRRV